MAAPAWYNQADKDIFKDNQFITQAPYRLDYKAPLPMSETEQVTETFGIPYTKAFTGGGGGGGGGGAGAYTGREYDPESYVTNRGYLSGKYIQGTEPEETKLQKFGHMMGQGIMNFVPGMRFIAGLDKFNTLSPADQEFARQQMSFNEDSVFDNIGNLPNQDRYGYNKRSLMGNYADVISKRVAIAKKYQADNPDKEIRDIDQYYLDKEEEQKALIQEMKFNDRKRLRYSADKIREMQAEDIDLYPSGKDIHGPDTPIDTPSKDVVETRGTFTGQHPDTPTKTPEQGGWHPGVKDGGRIGFFQGALADTKEGKAMSPGTSANYEPGQGHREGPQNTDTVPTNNLTVDTDLLTTKPSIEATYTPAEWANIRARLYNKNITKEDDINLEGNLSGSKSLIDYGIDFTDAGITGANVGMGPFRANISPNKNIENISFNKNIGDFNLRANTDMENYNLGATYQPNDWFTAGATVDNLGNKNFNIGAKLEFGQPEQTFNALSYQDQNPDLIYGLKYGGLVGIL